MDKLQLSQEQLQSRLVDLNAVLPNLSERLDTLQVQLLVELVKDPSDIAERVLTLKTLLPNLDVAQVVRRYPQLIACHSQEELRDLVQKLIRDCGDATRVGKLLSKEPRCLKIDMHDVLEEVRRIMPRGVKDDPLELFLKEPTQYLTMEQLGLETSNEPPSAL